VAILAHNEGRDLAALLATATFADEVVVADAESVDDTAAVAAAAGARVVAVRNDLNFNVNKTAAIAACRGEWILYLDPDERVPAALAEELKAVTRQEGPFVAFAFPRLNNYFGRYLRFGGAYPDYQLRLFRRGKAHFPCRSVHERLVVAGPVGRLAAPLVHESYPTPAAYLRKLPLYVAAGADYFQRRGLTPTPATDLYYLMVRPAARFIRRYIFKAGLLDGWPGLLACVLDAVQGMLAYFEFRRRPRPA